jgi:cell division septum initiation protein DivIVA
MTRPSNDSELDPTKAAGQAGQTPPTSAADTTADTQELTRLRLDDDPTTTISARPGFGASWRGYDRDQVDRYRSTVETDLANIRIGYQREVRAHAQLSEQLRARESDLARLRGQLTNSPSALSERLREILHLAEQDAEETRAAAKAQARQTRADAEAHADQVRADAETVLKHAQDAAAGIISRAHAEQQTSKADLEQEQAIFRQQLAEATNEADQARQHADAAAAARRDQAEQQARERREQAEAAAAARLRETSDQLAELTRQRDEAIASLNSLRDKLAKILNPPTDTEAPAAASS